MKIFLLLCLCLCGCKEENPNELVGVKVIVEKIEITGNCRGKYLQVIDTNGKRHIIYPASSVKPNITLDLWKYSKIGETIRVYKGDLRN